MLRIFLTAVMTAFLLAMPASAIAQSGIDAYTESPPSAGGGGGGGGGSGSSGEAPAPGSAGATDTGTDATSAATGTGETAAGVTDETSEADAALRGNRKGELAATGFDETALLALMGALLLVGGVATRRLVDRTS